MRVAVLTLTRDRLGYTKRSFDLLHKLGGCEFDHYVLDQGSQDGSQFWLKDSYMPKRLLLKEENVGISSGMNALLGTLDGSYDVVCKFDNDCELLCENTLKVACEIVMGGGWIVSPQIQGLNSPPGQESEHEVNGYRLGAMSMIGGIFMAIPGSTFDVFRYDEGGNPKWGMDDVQMCHWWKNDGHGHVGYLLDYPAFHMETTEGQRKRYPDYFARKDAEFG